jgi:GxxExxY protein
MNNDAHRSNGPQAVLTYEIIGCAMEVLNELGHGLHEKPCENAIVIELNSRKRRVLQQPSFEVIYKGHSVGDYVPDMIVDDRVVIDTKVLDRSPTMNAGR